MMSMCSRVALFAGAALLAAGCIDKGSNSSPAPPQPPTPSPVATPADTGPTISPPVRVGRWAYYGAPQGLSPDIQDVSADEGGNVYVAAGDALFAKARDAERFLRFDAENAGLSKRCNDDAEMFNENPPKPFVMCSVLSVAGAAPGKALIGYDGYGYQADGAADWAKNNGGIDVIAFDPVAGKATLVRHVLIAAPPHVVCDYLHDQWVDTCEPPAGTPPLPTLPLWRGGRRVMRRVYRIAVNHDPSTPMYGDAWMGGGHATFAALLNNTSQRNWKDLTVGLGSMWAETKDVWEHLHPVIDVTQPDGTVTQVYYAGYAMSIDPRTGLPWGSNGVRTAYVAGYGADLSYRQFGEVALDLWPDGKDPLPVGDAADDFVRSLSHCADGTLWAGSYTHGLARIDADSAAVMHVDLPGGEGAWSVACDWSDDSLWIGLASGGVLRRASDGSFTKIDTKDAPAFAREVVKNIQVDRWSKTGRVVYFAFGAARDANGSIIVPGGVAAYDGP
jgi:hypothetical protein